ncbi:hypothetical protein DLAC_01705 [Tieghemostelium lacteum]|uniref:FNIP repeat-containing protein n=1 Tax=Tieghemostelium lacteum TaxID=361077 RepID=A0A152A651_TIELA|nr:hypothetical protein DLAC_01705 [Tieghemostelium lacteum]|eukprot:KYR01700.1 hypothetical protein DLAC_01705 [Tieghemostelium lacteum]
MLMINIRLLIIDYLNSNSDLLNFISTSKSYYELKNRITFIRFPEYNVVEYYTTIDKNEETLSNTQSLLKRLWNKLSFKDNNNDNNNSKISKDYSMYLQNLPKRYKRMVMKVENIPPTTNTYYYIKLFKIFDTMYIESLEIDKDFELLLRVGVYAWPKGLKRLVMGMAHRYYGNTEPINIQKNFLPEGLETLVLGFRFTHKLIPGSLPQSLTDITIYNSDCIDLLNIDQVIPSACKMLKFKFKFESTLVPGTLVLHSLKGLETLELYTGSSLCLSGFLRDGIKTLRIGNGNEHFPDLLKNNILPSTLTDLTLSNFNFKIPPGVFPSSLTRLQMGFYDWHPLAIDTLPQSITDLSLLRYSFPLTKNSLPMSLKYLNLGQHYNYPLLMGLLPPTIKELRFSEDSFFNTEIHQLPESLELLKLGSMFNQSLDTVSYLRFLRVLYIGIRFCHPLPPLPQSLRELYIECCYEETLLRYPLPDKLYKLAINQFPETLEFQLNRKVLPDSINILVLGRCFSQVIQPDLTLPKSLSHLEFGYRYNKSLQEGSLPEGLSILKFNEGYKQYITKPMLPSTLSQIHITQEQRPFLPKILPLYCRVFITKTL